MAAAVESFSIEGADAMICRKITYQILFPCLLSLVSQSALAGASLKCEKLFTLKSNHAIETSARYRTDIAVTDPSPLAGVVTKFDFSHLEVFGSSIALPTQDPTGRWTAIVIKDQEQFKVHVVDIDTQLALNSDGYTSIKAVSFIAGSNLIAISATKKSDGDKHRVYLVNYSQLEKVQANASGTALATISKSTSLILGSQTTDVLDLPGSIYYGSGLTQIVARPDLPYVYAVQNSTNRVRDVYTRGGTYPLLNQSTHIFDPTSQRRISELSYDGLVPVALDLNPSGSLIAMTLTKALKEGRAVPPSFALIDAKNPSQILYQHSFSSSNLKFLYDSSNGEPYTVRIGQGIKTDWSADGAQLAVVEQATGSILILDAETQSALYSDSRSGQERWPIITAKNLENGKVLVLRQGGGESGLIRDVDVPKSIFVREIDPHSEKNKNETNLFQLKVSLNSELFKRYENGVGEVQIFEMNHGRNLAFILSGQIIIVDRQHPEKQSLLNPLTTKQSWRALILSSKQIDESTLRIVTQDGIFDINILP